MKSLIIGKGQIGQALFEIFSKHHECYVRDMVMEPSDPGTVEMLHIAYPYGEDFITATRAYISQYQPKVTIIHSSVAIGTTEKCGVHVVHSPERGRFPNLAQEMKAFPKFIGARIASDARAVAQYFAECGWESVYSQSPNVTEALKLISNVHLGLEIAWRQEISRMLKDCLPYEAWEDSYNAGHEKLGHKQLIRPRLKADPIGGHCILPCTDILAEQFNSPVFDFIRGSNEKRKKEVAGNQAVAVR